MDEGECFVPMEIIHDWLYKEKIYNFIPKCNDFFLKTVGKKRSSSQELWDIIKKYRKTNNLKKD